MRTPFLEVVEDPNLLGGVWQTLSWPQRVTLKAFYGCPLDDKKKNPKTGLTELDYWAVIQGSCEYDELGFVTKVKRLPYEPKEYEQIWAVVGRRAGKTSQLMSIILVYEALFGGHEQFIQSGQRGVIYYIAQRDDVATENLSLIRSVIKSSPLLEAQIAKDNLAEGIVFKNNIRIVPSSPSIKAQRGIAVPVVAMDEVAFWYNDPTAANPDYEVERAVAFAQLQFPNSKRVGISTPWTEEGLLWKYHKAGTEGRHLPPEKRRPYKSKLSVFAPTAAFENPSITREKLESLFLEDADAFMRESLCKFMGSVSGFVNKQLVDIAVEKGKGYAQRPPVKDGHVRPMYVAAMDPAFRHDSFGFAIVHKNGTGDIVTDVLRMWSPVKGTKLNPKAVLGEIQPLLTEYGISTIYSDQYQFESLYELALDMGFHIEVVDFTAKSKAKIYGNLESLINQKKLELLDPDLNDDAKATCQQLVQLEKVRTQTGNIQINAPAGKHDDMAAVLALAAHKANWYHPVVLEVEDNSKWNPSPFQKVMQMRERQERLLYGEDY